MRNFTRMAIALGVLLQIPAQTAAQKVNYDIDRTKNFARVHSFTVKEGSGFENPLVDKRVANAVVNELSARGMQQVDHDADVFIVPSMSSETRKEVTAFNTGYWPYYGGYAGGWGVGYWGAGWGDTVYSVRDLQYNTITIDMVEAKTGDLMWRGTGVKRVHDHWGPDKLTEKVQKTVGKIFAKFPRPFAR